MMSERNSPNSGNVSRESVSDLIRSVANHAVNKREAGRYGEDAGTDVASDFQQYLDDEDITPGTPPEWFAAWHEYVSQYDDTEPEDGEPFDIDDDSHYDPYTGGDDYLREHGEDDDIDW